MEEDQVDFSKLSVEDRCVHKAWKARLSAFEELIKIFEKIDDEKSPEWNKYTGLVRKFPTDNNAACQEKGLEATLIFMENSSQANRIVGEVMSGLIGKCLTAPKARSKELTIAITLMCIEIEKFEIVQDELMKGVEAKNPKVVTACIGLLTQALREFGPKVLNLKTIFKKIAPLSEDRDKGVREENKKLTVELYRWLGAGLKGQLTALKPVVMSELELEFAKIGSEKATQTRYLRSQQTKKEKMIGTEEVEEDEAGEEAADPDIDPYDLLEPVDILSKLPKDFYELCESKKWQERKEVLAALEGLVANPKLEPGDYADLVRALKRVIAKDNNVIVVASAGKCLAGLANGLKKKFSPYAPSCIGTILEKFKEKKPNVLTAMKEASDACFAATNLELIQEDAVNALGNKNPAVKTETALLLARGFSKTPYKTMSDKKLMKPYLTGLIANLNESDPAVRDASSEALGVALKSLGEKTMQPYLSDIDAIKLTKIKEFAEKAVVLVEKTKVTKPAPRPATAPVPNKDAVPAVLKTKPPSGAASKKPVGKTAPPKTYRIDKATHKAFDSGANSSTDIPEPSTSSTTAQPSKARVGNSKVAPKGKASPPGKKVLDEVVGLNLPRNHLKQQRIQDETKLKILRWQFNTPREEFVELLKDLMTTAGVNKNLIGLMFHSDFKMHLRALDILTEEMNVCVDTTMYNYDLILKWLTLRFFDTNPSVLIKGLDYVSHSLCALTDQGYVFADIEASSFVPYLLTKIGDPKDNIRTNVHSILRQLYGIAHPHKIFNFIMDGLKSKNARQRAECLDELSYMITNFTLTIAGPTPGLALKEIAKQISDRDNAVRNSALNCIVEAYFLSGGGDKVAKLIGPLADKDQSLLDERIKRAAKTREVGTHLNAPRLSNPPTAQAPASVSAPASTLTSNKSSPSGSGVTLPPNVTRTDSSPGGYGINTFTGAPRNDVQCLNETVRLSDLPLEDQGEVDPKTVEKNERGRHWTCPPKYRINFEEMLKDYGDETKKSIPKLQLHDTDIEYLKHEEIILPQRSELPRVETTTNVSCPRGATQSIDLVVSQLGNPDMRLVNEALVQLETLIADTAVASVMVTRVDTMVLLLTTQLRRWTPMLQIQSSGATEITKDVNNMFRYTILLLQTMYKGTVLPLQVSKNVLRDLIYHLLLLIVDPGLSVLIDEESIMKHSNVLVVKVIEKSDANAAVGALIRLLNDSLRISSPTRLLDLIMKCEWKMLKLFPVWVKEENYKFDIKSFILDFQTFFKSHPLRNFHPQNDTPLKTIKTIFHSLIQFLGPRNFLDAFDAMPELKDTETERYLSKLINREIHRRIAENIRDNNKILTTNQDNVSNNANNNMDEFFSSLPNPNEATSDNQKAEVFMTRLAMIKKRGGLSTNPSANPTAATDSLFN